MNSVDQGEIEIDGDEDVEELSEGEEYEDDDYDDDGDEFVEGELSLHKQGYSSHVLELVNLLAEVEAAGPGSQGFIRGLEPLPPRKAAGGWDLIMSWGCTITRLAMVQLLTETSLQLFYAYLCTHSNPHSRWPLTAASTDTALGRPPKAACAFCPYDYSTTFSFYATQVDVCTQGPTQRRFNALLSQLKAAQRSSLTILLLGKPLFLG